VSARHWRRRSGSQRGCPPLVVELLLLSADAAGITYRAVYGQLPARTEPDAVARRLGGIDQASGTTLHSTSWRYHAGKIILTYVAAPDPGSAVHHGHAAQRLSTSDDPVGPTVQTDVGEVAAHACRHLAFLALTDPVAAGALRQHPTLLDQIVAYTPGLAGRLTSRIAPAQRVDARSTDDAA
jgi:hypothetical protein